MKKGLALFALLIFGFGFVACGGTTTTEPTTNAPTTAAPTTAAPTTTGISDQDLVDQVYDWLTLGDITALTNSSPRLIMPTSKDGVTISWQISNTDYISTMGVISQPDNETGNQAVTITATLSKGTASETKVFNATVVALPPLEDTPPLINESFSDYSDGDIIPQTTSGVWGPVSGKTGSSHFYVVSQVEEGTIPGGSKALKINAFSELQIEAALVHDYDYLVIEADVYQTANGSPIYLQSSASSPVIGFGVQGGGEDSAKVFYRTDNGDMIGTEIELDTWYTIRLEVDFTNKTIQFFYYDEAGFLVQCTPGPVAFTGDTNFNSFFIRSGSSTTPALNENSSYITNIIANRPEALARPADGFKIGEVTGIDETVSVENGEVFTVQEPVVKNFYGDNETLVKDTDYTVAVTNPVDVNTDGEYTVTYTITNVHNNLDVKVITQTVTVYSPAQPNVINSVTSTLAMAEDNVTDITVNLLRAEGTLHYVISETILTDAEIAASSSKVSITITEATILIEDLVVLPTEKVYFVVELNGFSNVIAHEVTHQVVVEITTAQEFYDALHMVDSEQAGKYFKLMNDIDFTGFTWTVADNEFVAVFNGQGYTISNLTIAKTGFKGGIFGFVEDAIIKNLVIDNVHMTSDQDASGLLTSEIRGTTLIDNIVIMNSSNVTDGQYGGLIAGRIRSTGTAVTIKNISVSDTSVESKNNYGGGLVAGMDTSTSVVFEDIYLYNFSVQEATSATATGQMAGAIIGRVQGDTSISRVVGYNVNVAGYKNIGAIIGKSDQPDVTVTLEDIYIHGEIVWVGTDHANILVGNIADQTPTATNAWASGFTSISTLGLGVEEGHLIDATLTEVETWWTTNIPNILTSDLWQFEVDGPILNNLFVISLPKYTVILDYNMAADDDQIVLRQGTEFDFTAPEVPGYVFAGWFSDSALTTALADGFTITGDLTIYGKYETAPASTVSFDTGTEGPVVDAIMVNYGELATEPVVADTMIGGILKTLTGWTLDGVPFDFATPITDDITLVAVWETVQLTVSFEGMDPVLVDYGSAVTEPLTDPTHPAFSTITFNYWMLDGVEYDFTTLVTADISLSINWLVPATVEVTTKEQFEFLVNNDVDYNFLLMNDLDFTGYVWTAADASFEGVFDGGGYTISNLTIEKTGIKGGIFNSVEDATIKNLVLDNITTVSDSSDSGLLTSEIRGTTLIDNIVIMNSSNTSNGDYGAIITGRVKSGVATISNISIISTYMETTKDYGGGLVAGMETASEIIFRDIFLFDFIVKEATNDTGQMVGGVIGRVRANVTIERLYAYNLEVSGIKNAGGLIGKIDDPGTITLRDIYLNGEINVDGSTNANILVGNNEFDPTVTDVYATGFANASTKGIGLDSAYIVDYEDTQAEAWWTTNIPLILASPLWSYHYFMPALNNVITLLPDINTVTIDYNQAADDTTIYLWDDEVFVFEAPVVAGFDFDSWYSDLAMTTALTEGFVVTEDVTIYGKYDAMAQVTVTFDTTVGDVLVDPVLVDYNGTVSEPVVPQRDFEGIPKEVTGWTLNGNPFDFTTLVTGDITLVAVWETVSYTVSFEGMDSVEVIYGELVTEPAVDPTHEMFSVITFNYWESAGVQYDFSTPVTADLDLTINWTVPATIQVTTLDEFHYVATAGTDYSYVLMNNLDFTGYVWEDTGASFQGSFDGADFTISNLTFEAVNGYGGIFARANGATIENLVLDNINITTVNRVGILIGRIENGETTVQDIVVKNSSVSGADSNGTGGLIGQASYAANIFNVAVIDSTVYSTNKNVGGLIGRVDKANVIADDIYISGMNLTSTSTAESDVGLGGVIGYITNYDTSVFGAIRLVVTDTVLDGNAAGAYIGYVRGPGSCDLMDAYFEVTFVNGARTGLVGYWRDQTVALDQSSIFGSFTDAVAHSQTLDLLNTVIPVNDTWWDTNINSIYLSDFWTVNTDGTVVLDIAA